MSSPNIPPEVVLVIALVLAIVGIVWLSSRLRMKRLERLKQEAEEFLAQAPGGLRPIATRLILKDDEHALMEEPSTLFETRAHRIYGGVGARIGRVYVGGGSSESRQELRQIDQGTITLTTKRLIFDGSHENRSVALSHVLSVSPRPDAIEVSTERRAKSQIYSIANPLLWTMAVQTIASGKFSLQRQTANI